MNRLVVPVPLLGADDPAPVEVVDANSDKPILFVCEHAGRAVPSALGRLGLAEDVIRSHRGWDIGAERLAREVAKRLDAPLVIQRYSRLVVDCNRPPEAEGFVPAQSDGVDIPANQAVSADQRRARQHAIFDPLNSAIEGLFDAAPRRAAFSIHSFTPQMGGQDRPWHAGFLTRRDIDTARMFCAHIGQAAPELTLAINEPYQIETESDWFVPAHAEPRKLIHALIEIRNDQLQSEDRIARWADLLSGAITHILEQSS